MLTNATWIGFQHGINLGGWFSQCDYSEERYETFIRKSDLQTIAEWGLDHVRLPVDYNLVQREDGSLIESGFRRIKTVIEWCREYGLHLVLDLHKTIGFSFDQGEAQTGFFENKELQEHFYRLWEAFAVRLAGDSDMLAFELLNEVTDREFIGPWNRIAKECIGRIRKYAPETLILVGSYNNNGAAEVKYLEAPADENVIYNFHCYEPLKFTHQGAWWTDAIVPEERLSFEDSGTCEEYFEELFSSAAAHAKANNTVLYCGEFGVIDIVGAEDSLKWIDTISRVFDRLRIGRCLWCYKEMDFGIADSKYDGCRERLLEIL